MPFGFVRFPDENGKTDIAKFYITSPLPFGFVRFPDIVFLMWVAIACVGVSIAFRLRSLSRPGVRDHSGLRDSQSPLPFGFVRFPDRKL